MCSASHVPVPSKTATVRVCVTSTREGRPPEEVTWWRKGRHLAAQGGEDQDKTAAARSRNRRPWLCGEGCPSPSLSLLLPKLINTPDMSQPRPRFVVDRAAYSLTLFDEEFEKKDRTYPLGAKLRHAFR